MSKWTARRKAEEKKKSSASSASTPYEKAKQVYQQEQRQAIADANAAARSVGGAQTSEEAVNRLNAYREKLAQLQNNYGYDISDPVKAIDREVYIAQNSPRWYDMTARGIAQTTPAWGGKGGKVGKEPQGRGGRVTPLSAKAYQLKQNTLKGIQFDADTDAGMMYGTYNPTAAERTRIGNTLAAGGKGWTAGQASALGFLLDPTDDGSMTDAEMMFGNAADELGNNRAAQWLNEKRAKATQALYGSADALNAEAAESERLAKQGLGGFGRTLVDMGITGSQMALDAAFGRVTGLGMSSMASRTFGQSAREALANGATQQQAFNYGMNAALVEVGTEKMFDVLKIFGGGAADEALEQAIRRMAKTDLGRTALRVAGGFGGEALEELASGIINPLIRSEYDKNALKDYKDLGYWSDTFYEALVGGLLGAVGGGGQIVTGQNAAANQRLRMQDALDAAKGEAVNRYAARFGTAAPAVQTVYNMNKKTAVEDFQRGFEAAYYMGREGVAVEEAVNAPSTSALTENQRRSAWEIGRDAKANGVETVKLETMEGGTGNGTAVDLRRGGERNLVQNPGGKVREVESRAGSEAEGPRIADNAKDPDVQSVKTRREAVSIPGMREQDLLVPEEKSYTPEMKKAMKNAAKDGVQLHFFMGDYLKRYMPDGSVRYSRGVSDSNGNMWVRADDPNYTASQIARHEGGHDLIARGMIDLDDAREKIVQTLGEEAYRQALDDYRDAYDGADMTDEEVFEEIVCDARGGMNIFEGAGVRYDEAAKRIVPVQQAARESIRERSGKETRGPPAEHKTKFSDVLQRDADYMAAVNAGDMETAQRMVDEAAKKWGAYSGPDSVPIHFYHGTRNRFNVFEKARQGQNYGGDSRLGKGFYFAHTRESAEKWARGGSQIVDAYLQMRRPLDLRSLTPDDIAREIERKYQQKQSQYEDWFPISKEKYLENLKRLKSYDLEHPGSFIDSFKYDKNGKMTDGIREFLSSLGYDGIISEDEAVVFEPEQIKSADPITYDDDGNIIPLSERFNDKKTDIRWSRDLATEQLARENRALEREVDTLTKQVQRWKRETKLTKRIELREGDVTKTAKAMIDGMDSTADVKDVAADMKYLAEYILNGGKGDSADLSWTVAREMATDIAEKVVGAVRMNERADVVTGEDAVRFYDEAVTWAANDVIDRVLDEGIRQMPPTFADKAKARLQRVREQGNERVERTKREYTERSRKAIERITERHEREIRQIKERNKEVRQNERERSAKTATWHKIQKLGAKFRQMAEHPAEEASKHSPRDLAKALQGIADVFYTAERKRSSETLNSAIQTLRTTYSALKDHDSYGIYYDPQLAEINDVVEKALVNTPVNKMTPEELELTYRLLRAHMHNITSANKFVTGKWAKGIWETGRDWSAEVDGASPVMKGWIGDFLNWQLRPDSFFRRISGFAKNSVGERVQKMFSDGMEKMLKIQQDAYFHFRKYTESKEFNQLSKRGKKDLVDVGLKDENGNTVLLTRDMMLAVYMHLSSEQNLQAATYGGFDVPELDAYYTGRTARSYDRSTRTMNVGSETRELQNELNELLHDLRSGTLSDEDAQDAKVRIDELQKQIKDKADAFVWQMLIVRENISKQLTEYEKGFVEAAHEWMQKSADYINAETLAMYGIEKAQVENYWPMHRNTNFVNTDMRTVTDEINLENWGSLKERVQSRAPLKLTGFGFEIDNHTKKMSQFCGFAAAQRDFNKLYNTRLPSVGSSLSEKIQRKFGSEERKMGASGQQYIDAYIAAVSGADKSDATIFSVIRRNLPRATLTLNLRVAVSQLASMPTAAAEVGWGSVAKGLPRGLATAFNPKAKERLAKRDPWFWQRYRGEGGMREFADMKEERNWLDRFYNRTASAPVIRRLVNWCQDFDVFATASMWAMSEEWVKSNTDLKPGTQEFDAAVSAKYADVIRRTQPNYTVTERSGLLRDKREGYKILTMYKTQSNQNLNILYDANATLMKYKKDFKAGKNGVTKADVQEAEKQFARAYTAVLLGGSVTFAVLRSMANALLHAVNRYRDDDDELTMESVMNGILEETISAMAGMFAFGSAVYDIVHSLVTGDKYYGLNESAIEALSNLAEQSAKILEKALDRDKDVDMDDVEKLVKNACNILGIPWTNGKTIVEGIVNHVRDAQNGEFLSFNAGLDRTATKEVNKIVDHYLDGAGDKLQRAWDELLKLKDGDEKKAQEAVRGGIKDAYLAGEITDKQALDLLKRYGGKDGDDAKKDYLLKWQCEKDTGFAYKDLRQAYLDDEITEKQAAEYLKKYGGMDGEKAKDSVTGWRAEKETGVALGDMKEAYLDGDITKAEVIRMKMKYDGKTQEEAEEYAQKLECEKDFGIEYGVKNVQEALVEGKLTETQARTIWTKYGGKDEDAVDDLIKAAQFVKAHPTVDIDNVTTTRINVYEKYAPKTMDAGKFMEYAAQIKKDQDAGKYPGIPDGKGGKKAYSVMDDVARWIMTLPLKPEEKIAVFLTYTNGKTTSVNRYKWS